MPPPQYPNQPQNPYGQQPPGPYGQQAPGAPGPYGQQAPGAPGPYGQQPYPAQPYPPQTPHPQQPYPAWGMPPMAPPPKRRRVGLVLGIVGGVVTLVVVGLVLLGMVVGSGFPEAKNKLALPHTLLDDRYKLAEDASATEGKKIEKEADGAWDAKDMHAVVGRYGLDGGSQSMLLVSGMYGRFKNEASIRRNLLKGAAEADGVTVEEPAKDVTPAGADTTVTCQVLTQKASLVTVTYPVCSWADGNTAAIVGEVDRSTKDPSGIDLEKAARSTLQVRHEMLQPIG
ncbi:hypothetical protein JK359_28515 [Streptomyces actinomycinicus]|uniref:Uncharacterized protein n=1 Tax=Streptomyces actinomycinicus TaxID=1695166 RepID=A0A937EPW2_9ACTN|nr:hypothetical protein [Streptomyces actinomycinicus]MBL1085864.1 hypothetical protein [Streptomyces actinomycinicus]